MASMATSAEPTHSTAASVSRSLIPLSQSSPKGVHPIPTMATRSRIPVLVMTAVLLLRRSVPPDPSGGVLGQRSSLPEVIVYTLGAVQPAEGHGHPGADGHRVGVDVGHLAPVAAPAVEVDDRPHHRGREAESQPVDGVGGHGSPQVGHAFRLHLVHRLAGEADPGGGQVAEAAHQAPTGVEPELPPLGPVHGRGVGPLGIGTPGRLAVEHAPPRQEDGVGQVRPPLVRPGPPPEPGRPPAGPPGRPGGRRWCAGPRRRPRRPLRPARPPGRAWPARARRPGPDPPWAAPRLPISPLWSGASRRPPPRGPS